MEKRLRGAGKVVKMKRRVSVMKKRKKKREQAQHPQNNHIQ